MPVVKQLFMAAFTIAYASGAARAASEKVVYSFQASHDGVYPEAGLIDVGGTLYGTTSAGSGSGRHGGAGGRGAVFKLTKDGAETRVFVFSGSDGWEPLAGLVNVGGTLYGTTYYGGDHGDIFGVTLPGAESLLYSFKGTPDGQYPTAGLIKVGGSLYGTAAGGSYGYGTVFEMKKNGRERLVYSFKGGTDGVNPQASLIDVNGTLYGTTASGGGSDCGGNGCGTVFSVTKTGVETVVHAFTGGKDGANPVASLINVDGTLYGTTNIGGAHNEGTVFKVTTDGVETVLYSFTGGKDGANPLAGLTNVNGTLYGTTQVGGITNCLLSGNSVGCGTVYSITPDGQETVVYSFQGGNYQGSGGSDGAFPSAGLINMRGILYGTTLFGGKYPYPHNCVHGCGTVFAVTP